MWAKVDNDDHLRLLDNRCIVQLGVKMQCHFTTIFMGIMGISTSLLDVCKLCLYHTIVKHLKNLIKM